jgi:NAD(P)-dependent dehydrogenase (short-subunit alcohol dehydrogenase family)
MSRANGSSAERFRDAIAIVTGGASGIGAALCEALCAAGATVVVADINGDGASRLAAALVARGGRGVARSVDVASMDQVAQLVRETVDEFGRIDLMFNNAAATATRGELLQLPIEPWHSAIEVNLLGVVHGTLAAYAQMARQGCGHIVNTASLAGLVGFPTSIPYSATKSAVVNLSLSLRMEAASRGIRVTVICPGQVHGTADHPLGLVGVQHAAQLILRGVARERSIVVFPLSARLLWLLHRISPDLLFPIGERIVHDFRRRQAAQPSMAKER